jgi:hypothetical protein
VEVWKTPKYTP